jgi:hypothetical protein
MGTFTKQEVDFYKKRGIYLTPQTTIFRGKACSVEPNI